MLPNWELSTGKLFRTNQAGRIVTDAAFVASVSFGLATTKAWSTITSLEVRKKGEKFSFYDFIAGKTLKNVFHHCLPPIPIVVNSYLAKRRLALTQGFLLRNGQKTVIRNLSIGRSPR